MLTEIQLKNNQKECSRIGNNKLKYEREMNAVPKEIPYKNVIPTEEELKILDIAIGYHLVSANKKRSYNFLTKGDVMADAYEGLVKSLFTFKTEKVKNKKNYLINKIKFHLIDCYRRDYGRNNNRITEFNTMSLNVRNEDGIEDGTECIDLILSREPNPEEIYENKKHMEYIEERFSEISQKSQLSGDDIFATIMLRFEGYSLSSIAIAADITESRLCQIMNQTVQPLLRDISLKLTGRSPELIPMK